MCYIYNPIHVQADAITAVTHQGLQNPALHLCYVLQGALQTIIFAVSCKRIARGSSTGSCSTVTPCSLWGYLERMKEVIDGGRKVSPSLRGESGKAVNIA